MIFISLLFNIMALASTPIHMVEVNGSINPGSATYIMENLREANSSQAQAFILKLNTPGGLLNSTRDIIQSFSQSNIPVIVFVTPGGASATSAGALIAISAHIAAMSAGTNLGAAHPVGSGGEDVKGTMGEKVTNDTAALARAQAALRGRNLETAELIVTKSKSLSAEEALKANVINFIANDVNDLLRQIDGKKIKIQNNELIFQTKNSAQEIVFKEMNLKQKFIHFISDPNISTLLIALGGVALYAEISSGFSIIAPGVFGVFCFVLGFISLQTLPINIGGAILFVLGFALLIAEAYITSYGLLTLAAMVSILLGGLFLIDPGAGSMRVSFTILIPLLSAIGFVCAFIAYQIAKDRLHSLNSKKDPVIGKSGKITLVSGDGKSGSVLVNGEIWKFESHENLQAGDEIHVKNVHGLKLNVERKK